MAGAAGLEDLSAYVGYEVHVRRPAGARRRYVRLCSPPTVTVKWSGSELSVEGDRRKSVLAKERLGLVKPVEWLPEELGMYSYDAENAAVIKSWSENLVGLEASSAACVQALELKPTDVCLDLCAAPGGKSMLMADLAKSVVAVDVSQKRLEVMQSLLRKHMYKNVTVLIGDGRTFRPGDESTYHEHVSRKRAAKRVRKALALPATFDKVLVDAECTHDGSIKHLAKYEDTERLTQNVLNPDRLRTLPDLQYALLENGWACLTRNTDSRLIYSTCSFSKLQNEEIVERFLKAHPEARLVELPYGSDVPCERVLIHGSRVPCALFGRHDDSVGGLFVALLAPEAT